MSRQDSGWKFVKDSPADVAARVTIPQEIAWRIFTKGIDRDLAKAQIAIEGDHRLGNIILDLTAIVA